MRSYLPVTPRQISLLIDAKQVEVTRGFSLVGDDSGESEEQEFITSWLAATDSADSNSGWGFVLVTEKEFPGLVIGENNYWQSTVEIAIADVECVLVAEFDNAEVEEELSWFAVQEMADHLSLWLTKATQ